MSAEHPTIRDARSRLARLLDPTRRPARNVDLPGVEGERVGLWVLTQAERDEAGVAARKHVRDKLHLTELDSAMVPGYTDDALAVEELALALRDPDDARVPFAKSGDELRKLCSPRMLAALHEQYLKFVEDEAPLKRDADPETALDELVELAGKAPAALTMWLRSRDTLSRLSLLAGLVDRLASAQITLSSPPSSPSDTASSSTG